MRRAGAGLDLGPGEARLQNAPEEVTSRVEVSPVSICQPAEEQWGNEVLPAPCSLRVRGLRDKSFSQTRVSLAGRWEAHRRARKA